jgi:alginate O-acetyltransferase complex protein AlgI
LLAVMGGWVLFRCETLAQAVAYYGALLGRGQGDASRHALPEYLDPFVAFTLVVGIVFATPLARAIGQWRDRHANAAVMGLDVAWLAVVFVLATAFLAAGTYNPFIYFRF